jgi:hypothetical protein
MAEARALAQQLLEAIRELISELRQLRQELDDTKTTPTGGSDG